MGYVDTVLQPGEEVVARGAMHWIVYRWAIVLCVLTAIAGIFYLAHDRAVGWLVVAGLIGLATLVAFVAAWFDRFITEIAVTDRRVIYKKGFISRHTAEMNLRQVESVSVRQSILGRLLGYGTIHIKGTGAGIEHLHNIGDPISLRHSIMHTDRPPPPA